MAAKGKGASGNYRVVAENRKARYNYSVEETLEAGLELTGTEVKSLREGKANIAESYASDESGDLVLINAYIPEYLQGNRFNHAPRRPRRILMHRRELDKWIGQVNRGGMAIIPLKIYFNERGIAKLLLGLAQGKKLHDKRQTERKRDWDRQKARLLRDKG